MAVPVNLRPYFDSITTKNFFVMVSAEFAPQKNEYTFAEILTITKDSLRAQINKEHLEKIFSYNVSNELMVVARAVPLFLKNLAMRLVYTQSALANTTTVTNIGNIKVRRYMNLISRPFILFYLFQRGRVSRRLSHPIRTPWYIPIPRHGRIRPSSAEFSVRSRRMG